MERSAGHPEFSGQLREPPLILCRTSLSKIAWTPAANCSQPESLEHFGDGLPAQSSGLLGRAVAFPVERFSDLLGGELLCNEFADTLAQLRIVAQVLYVSYRSDHHSLGLGTSDPLDGDVQPFALAFILYAHSLDDLAHYLLALGGGRI